MIPCCRLKEMSWPLGPVLVQWSKREAMPPQWTRELKTRSTELVYAHGGASIRAWRVGVCRLAMSAYCCAALSCDAGWHMSYFMTVGQVINKLASFSHQEYNRVRRRDAALRFPLIIPSTFCSSAFSGSVRYSLVWGQLITLQESNTGVSAAAGTTAPSGLNNV